MLNIKQGRLLISEPSLSDPTFFKSVVLITHHCINESVGLILNQKTKINLNELIDDIPSSNFPVYIGGPVEKNAIQFIHTIGNKISNAQEIIKGLYWGGDFNKVIELIHQNRISKEEIRFFAGYAGWHENQLNTEIRNNGWITHKSDINLCMKYSDHNLWSTLMKTKKEKYAIWANMPTNPSLN